MNEIVNSKTNYVSKLNKAITSCSSIGYEACTNTNLEKNMNNIRYECNSFGAYFSSPYCWQPVANLGDDDFCSSKAPCLYGQWDCDSDSQCSSNYDCVDYDGYTCLLGQECGCCNVGEKWISSSNTCFKITNPSITSVYWSSVTANTGDIISLNVQTIDIPNGESVVFEIWEDDGLGRSFGDDKLSPSLFTTINNNFAQTNWEVLNNDDSFNGNVEYYFVAKVSGKEKVSTTLNTKFGRNGWDCDQFRTIIGGQCASNLICDGNTPTFDLENEGCCYNYENWNAQKKFCNYAVSGKIFQVTQIGQTFSEYPYGNLKLKVFVEDEDLLEDDVIKSFEVYPNANGEFNFNPEYYISNWNLPPILIDYKINSIFVIENNEIIGKWTNHFSNKKHFRIGEESVKQIVRIHKDKTSWEKNYFPDIDTVSLLKEKEKIEKTKSITDLYLLKWKGNLVIDKEDKYYFSFNVTGDVKLIMNNQTYLDTIQSKSKSKDFEVYLEKGEHELYFEFYEKTSFNPIIHFGNYENKTNEASELNFKKFETEMLFLDETEIITKAIGPVNNNPDYMISFLEEPEIMRNTKPLILIHGKHGESGYWEKGGIQNYFNNEGYDAWEFYYPGDDSIDKSGALLGDALDYLKRTRYGSSQKFDIISHSMGGLVSRSYIQGISSYSYKNDVAHLVMIGTPNYGTGSTIGITQGWKTKAFDIPYWKVEEVRLNPSILIDKIRLHPESWISLSSFFGIESGDIFFGILIKELYYNVIDLVYVFNSMTLDNTNSPIYKQMSLGSQFIEELNTKNVYVNSLVIIGNKDKIDTSSGESFLCSILNELGHQEGEDNEHDCFVAISSSSLLDKNITLSVISNKNHATEKDKIKDYSASIVYFLQNKSDSDISSQSYAYFNPKTGYKKNFNQYDEGSIQIKILENGGIWNQNSNLELQIESISSGQRFNMTRNIISKNYFHFNRQDGKIDSYYTIPIGEYKLIIPGYLDNPKFHFNIKPMETNFLVIDLSSDLLDNDNDGISNTFDKCPSLYGTYCNGCPTPSCGLNTLPTCPINSVPICQTVDCSSNSDCGIDGFSGPNFCSQSGDAVGNLIKYLCNKPGTFESFCSSSVETKVVDDCSSFEICNNGICQDKPTGICSSNSQCGSNGYISGNYCSANDDSVRDYRTFICNNPGTSQSNCTSIVSSQIVDTCTINEFCNNGICQNIPDTCSSNSQCGTDGYIDSNKCGGDGNVYRDWKINICYNQNTPQSYCGYNINSNLIQNCLYGCENGECKPMPPIQTPQITILNPSSEDYPSDRIPVSLRVTSIVDSLIIVDVAGSRTKSKVLCYECDEYDDSYSLREGSHIIKFQGWKDGVLVDEEVKEINIDTTPPKITKTLPRKGFSNGDFSLEFRELNPSMVTLYYGIQGDTRGENINLDTDCQEGQRGKSCHKQVYINSFDGSTIQYKFEVKDGAGNVKTSKPIEIEVDISRPIVAWNTPIIDGRRVTFRLFVDEINFDEVIYIDTSDSRPKERRLCSRLNENKFCEKRITLREGTHNINVFVKDEAGNIMAIEGIEFVCNDNVCQ